MMVVPIAAFVAAGILLFTATFTYFGGYWYQLWKMRKGDDD